jgi:hypothetical protein
MILLKKQGSYKAKLKLGSRTDELRYFRERKGGTLDYGIK